MRMEERVSKVDRSIYAPVATPLDWLSRLPDALAARDLRRLVERVVQYHRAGKPLVWMMGAHPLKVGLGPLLCDLIRQGWVQHLAVNGAAIVHDVELTLHGHTSEDVEAALGDGSYGQTEETLAWINRAIYENVLADWGLGRAIGECLLKEADVPVAESLFATCVSQAVPITVHVAIGTDVYHAHPSADGALLGEGSLADFDSFINTLLSAKGQAALLNWGSAVILPEVALKTFGVLRRQQVALTGLVAANFDMISQYRPRMQLVERVRGLGGEAFDFRGHHELLLPLLAAALLHADLQDP